MVILQAATHWPEVVVVVSGHHEYYDTAEGDRRHSHSTLMPEVGKIGCNRCPDLLRTGGPTSRTRHEYSGARRNLNTAASGSLTVTSTVQG